MKDVTLVVMAAGMGSRYGGIKQLDAFGPESWITAYLMQLRQDLTRLSLL